MVTGIRRSAPLITAADGILALSFLAYATGGVVFLGLHEGAERRAERRVERLPRYSSGSTRDRHARVTPAGHPAV